VLSSPTKASHKQQHLNIKHENLSMVSEEDMPSTCIQAVSPSENRLQLIILYSNYVHIVNDIVVGLC